MLLKKKTKCCFLLFWFKQMVSNPGATKTYYKDKN